MIQETQAIAPRLPHLVGTLSHANQYLKAFSMGVLIVAVLAIVALLVSLTRAPVVLTLKPDGGRLIKSDAPAAEVQVREALQAYLDKRYQWEASSIQQHLTAAQAFIGPASLKAYVQASGNLVRFSTEKQVSQRVYPDRFSVDLAKGEVAITGDRITTIQGIKAAGVLNLVLKFESGPRNETNPWGVYVTSEKEVQ